MATESLAIEIDVKNASLNKKLSDTTKELNKLEASTESTDSSLGGLSKAGGIAAESVKLVAGAGIAAVTALTALVAVSSANIRELELLSAQAKVSATDFQALAFATEQYGITAEQFGDISKDIADKVGEFSTSGTGAFQDYADALGLTQEQARATAQEFEELSSDQVIGEVVRQLEEAGASANETTFVLESLGSDLSKLTPLFAENSKELEALTSRYKAVNDQLNLTTGQQEDLQELATTFDLLTSSLGNAANIVASTLAPQFDAFFNAIIEIVPEAIDTIVDFINTFQDASNIQSISSLNSLLDDQEVRIERLQNALIGYNAAETSYNFTKEEKARLTKEATDALELETQRQFELQQQLESVIATEEEAAAIRRQTGSFTSSGLTGTNLDLEGGDSSDAELQAIQDRFKSEEELLAEKLERELEIIGENNDLKLQLEAEYQQSLADLQFERIDAELAAEEKRESQLESLRKADAKEQAALDKTKTASNEAYLSAAVSVGELLFEDNKAVRAGLVVADTAAGITRAFADLPYPAALAASASIAATGAASLSTINSSAKGSTTSSTVSAASVDADTDTVDTDTETLLTSASDVSGNNQTFTIKVEADDSEVATAISSILGNAQITGLIS